MLLHRRQLALRSLSLWLPLLAFALAAPTRGADFRIEPPELALQGNFARAQLVVSAVHDQGTMDERSEDWTRRAQFVSTNGDVVSVSTTGLLQAIGDGEASIQVTVEGVTKAVPVRVQGVLPVPQISFQRQVRPVLSKAGCNAGACHASQYGKGGFKLSVFGFAPDEDYDAIVRDAIGRRVNQLEPEKSLLLLKPTMAVPHAGGRRLHTADADYQILQAWIKAEASGGPPARPVATDATVKKIDVFPRHRVGAPERTQQLRVVAELSDGRIEDVTAWAQFSSMDDAVVSVSSSGLVQMTGRGQAPVLVRFEGFAEIASFVVPYAENITLADWADHNFIDQHAAAKFRELGIVPSPLCDDATFLRRAYLDAIGTLPTVDEAVAFLDSSDPQKRVQLVDRLLGLTGDPAQDIYGDAYAAWWSLKWADLIRSSGATLGEQGMWSLHNWLQTSFRENKPFDRFVRELITARGSAFSHGPANYYRVASNPQDLAETTAQLFLGTRLQCAKCHHHPYENLGQEDYYGFAAFFARVGTKGSQEFGLFGGETIVVVRSGGEVTHPKTGAVLPPKPLGGAAITEAADRRQSLADWLTARDNPLFARNVVNRYVAYLLGRGLVEPIDDLRATNPATNAVLLDALARDFAENGYDVKRLLRTLLTSRLYQLDSQPTPENVADSKFYSHFHVKRLAAEPLLDAIDRATGVPTKFRNVPLGTPAIALPDSEYPDLFLKTFGKPRRVSVCECERSPDANLAQALHTLNGDNLAAKIANAQGRIARLIAAGKSFDEIVPELYLAAWSRRPTAAELDTCRQFLAEASDPPTFYQDLLWTLLNSKQFLYVH